MDKPQKLDALTSLRFFAAAMIVLTHAHYLFGSFGLATTFALGQGVSFFFVLSGFILAYNYPVLATWSDIRQFFKARLARVWPTHIAAIALLVVLTGNFNVPGLSKSAAVFAGVANFFLFQSLVPLRDVFLAFNGVAWSISTELCFYFAFPLLIANTYIGWKPKLALIAFSVVCHLWFAAAFAIPVSEAVSGSANLMGVLKVNPFVRLLEFFIGIMACWSFTRLRQSINAAYPIWTLAELVLVLLALISMHFSPRLIALLDWQGPIANVLAYYLNKVGSFWIFAPLIVVFAFGKGLLSKLLSIPPMVLLGEISFALYLVHTIIIKWYETNAAYFEDTPAWLSASGYWSLCLAISYLLHKIVETPCRRLIMSTPTLTARKTLALLASKQQLIYVMSALIIIGTMRLAPVYGPLLFMPDRCPPSLCGALATDHRLDTAARFGHYVTLDALQFSTANGQATGYSHINCLFTNQEPLPAGYRLAIHLLDGKGVIVAQADALLVKNRNLKAGEHWLQSLSVPTRWLTQGTTLGIAVYNTNGLLSVTYPKTDLEGRRALFTISETQF